MAQHRRERISATNYSGRIPRARPTLRITDRSSRPAVCSKLGCPTDVFASIRTAARHGQRHTGGSNQSRMATWSHRTFLLGARPTG